MTIEEWREKLDTEEEFTRQDALAMWRDWNASDYAVVKLVMEKLSEQIGAK